MLRCSFLVYVSYLGERNNEKVMYCLTYITCQQDAIDICILVIFKVANLVTSS